MEDVEAQKDEVLALQSIFDESQVLINSTSNHHTGCIFVKPELEDNFTVLGDETELKIQHLCPLELHFILPSEYPSTKPPHFTLVCKWLTRDQVNLAKILFQVFQTNEWFHSCPNFVLLWTLSGKKNSKDKWYYSSGYSFCSMKH